ncbi:phage tail protein [Rivihabitans pingtungensis]|uniref:phage tail protein n=1 Tax=Rivihabitans pingtungensis TaxID=1054498 RepID=UPI002354793D|nr:phage tail protein [Rivihabitans pingtungensis]MCK6435959.1 phage tail protein [Rivihabitans pingtungensis]
MFDDLIGVACRHTGSACEKARQLSGVIANEAASADLGQRSQSNITRLADTWQAREAGVVDDLHAAEAALHTARASGDASASTGRSLDALSAALLHIGDFAAVLAQGAASMASATRNAAISTIGANLVAAVESVALALDSVRQAFTAAFNPVVAQPVIEPSATLFAGNDFSAGLGSASSAQPHLLILTAASGDSYYFNLSSAAFESLRRQSSYNIASQDRLTRRPALQAVSKGGETITVSGAIFTKLSGAGQLNALRAIGFRMAPLVLTTGYGDTLGQWYLARIDEEQSHLFIDGLPRKQQFTLEFQRYGEDYSDI